MTRCTALALLMLAALGVGTAGAQPVTGLDGRDRASVQAVQSLEAYAVYKMGLYALARERWEALAATGNTTAMINLAAMHAQGQGVPKDPLAARAWLQQAADRGDARAIEELAQLGQP